MANNAVKAALERTNEFLFTLSDVEDLNIMLLHIRKFCEIGAGKDTFLPGINKIKVTCVL
jgi:hypothetical protein